MLHHQERPCKKGQMCFVQCAECKPKEFKHSVCKMCHGAGYVTIRGGEDTAECPRCGGTGKEAHHG